MTKISAYIIPTLIIVLIILSVIKRTAVFDSFAEGAREGLKLAISVFPFLCAVFVCVTLFRVSGLAAVFTKICAPIFKVLGIPAELSELIMLRPFSGSGTLAELENIYGKYGADSYISRCASVILGSTETVFYVSAVYFSKSNVKNLSYGIPLALLISIFGAAFSCLLCRFM